MNADAVAAPVLIVMLKAPRAGEVKTRLARETGPQVALEIYRALVERQMAAISPEWRVEIHGTPADALPELSIWLGAHRTYFPQPDGDLGTRLDHAITTAFSRGAATVLAIGADCPTLDETTLRAAAHALTEVDVVLGPAIDGGYYLIGLRRPEPGLFRDIPWSTTTVLDATLVRVREAGCSVALLAAKDDVDNLASWRRAESSMPKAMIRSAPRG